MYIRFSTLFVFIIFSVYHTLAKPKAGYCDGCVNYNFESDFDDLFTNEKCASINGWKTGKYSDVDVERPNEYTETFITPDDDLSCSTSFPFSMTGGGTVQVNMFMNITNAAFTNDIYVFAEQVSTNSSMGSGHYAPLDSSFQSGWNTLTFTLLGSDTFDGHLIFLGFRNQTSTVLVDSFCYKPASYDGDCWVDYASTTAQPEATTYAETELTTETTWEVDIITATFFTTAVTDSDIDFTTSNNDLPTTENDPTTSVVTESTSVPEIDSTTSSNDLTTIENDSTAVTAIDSTTSNIDTTETTETVTTISPTTVTDTAETTISPTTVTDTAETTIASTTVTDAAEPTEAETTIASTTVTVKTEPTEAETTISPSTVTDAAEPTETETTIASTTVTDETVSTEAETTISPTTVTDTAETTIASTTVTVETEPTEAETTISPTTVTDTAETTVAVPSTTGLPTITVSEPTLPTQAPSNNQCHENPFIHWLVPHEHDCNLFYYCVWGEKVPHQCPAGLHFNPIIQVCDWPWNAGCTTQ